MNSISENEYFAFHTTHLENWLINAVHLCSSAELIFEKSTELHSIENNSTHRVPNDSVEYSSSYLKIGLLLASYAFESLLKSLYIAKNKDNLYSGILKNGEFPGSLRNHTLLELINKNDLPIINGHREFLKKLSNHAIWIGRYPVPLNTKQLNDSTHSLTWSQADINSYYPCRDYIFNLLDLDYDKLKNLGIEYYKNKINSLKI